MIRVITSGMFVVGLVSLPVALSTRQTPAPAPDYRHDPRLETLRISSAAPIARPRICRSLPRSRRCQRTRLAPAAEPLFCRVDGRQVGAPQQYLRLGFRTRTLPQSDRRHPHRRLPSLPFDLYKDKALDSLLATYNPNIEYAQKVKSVMRRISPSE